MASARPLLPLLPGRARSGIFFHLRAFWSRRNMGATLMVLPHSAADIRAARLAKFAPQQSSTNEAPKPPPKSLPTTSSASTATGSMRPSSRLPVAPAEASGAGSKKRPSSESIDSAALFRMGFEPESVGRALVTCLGDAPAALELLRSGLSSDDDDDDLALALRMSLEQPATTSPSSNPHWNPPRYIPPEGTDALRVIGGKTLSLVEFVEVRDGGYSWQPATAYLDTGNQHKTIIDTDYARRHAIYRPASEAAAIFGEATGSFGQAESWTTVNGVVPGASVRAPVVTIGLKIRGEEYLIPAIVSEMKGHDLLLGVDVLTRLFNSGFQIGAGSV